MNITVIFGAMAMVGAVAAFWWGLTATPSKARANLFAGLPQPPAPPGRSGAIIRRVGTAGRRMIPHQLVDGLEVKLVQAAAGAEDGELLIETDGDNLGASHIVSGDTSGKAIPVPSLRLQRILEAAAVSSVDALKIDVEGYEDRVLTGFFKQAPRALWPRAVVIELVL